MKTQMMRRLAVLGATGAVAMGALSGCGSSDAESSAQTTAVETEVSTPETMETEPTAPFTAERTITWELVNDEGNAMRLKLQLGAVTVPEDVASLESSFSSLADVCAVDTERDVFIPIRASAKNLTEGFSIEPTVRITNPKTSNFEELETAANYSDGASCTTQEVSTEPWLGVAGTLGPDEQFEKDFLAVLHGYRSPDSPEGNPEAFDRAFGQVRVTEGTSLTDRYEPTCLDTDALNVWAGHWNGLIRAHFAVLPHASGVGVAEEALPGC